LAKYDYQDEEYNETTKPPYYKKIAFNAVDIIELAMIISKNNSGKEKDVHVYIKEASDYLKSLEKKYNYYDK
jgi:hypothetical protein